MARTRRDWHGSGRSPVEDTGPLNRQVLGDGKGFAGVGDGDEKTPFDILKPHAPASAGLPPMATGDEMAVDNTTGIHDGGQRIGSKRKSR